MTENEKALIAKVKDIVNKHSEFVEKDYYRLKYHLMPPIGLMNDPNGFIHHKDKYHIFYQWNPFTTAHGSKFWGHYTSKDMVDWKHENIAIAPSEWYENSGCYSGSAVENDGMLIIIYTGNRKTEQGEIKQCQCKAVSKDGLTFEKRGVVLEQSEGYKERHFRDPKVWKKDNEWYMILGTQNVEEEARVTLYKSDNLIEWKRIGDIAGSNLNGLNSFGFMWECPDLFHINGYDVLIVSPEGIEPQGTLYNNKRQSGYFIGKLDYETGKYIHGNFSELDRGFDFYAPQTTLDNKGRRLMFAWMGMSDESEGHHPTIKHHWIHAMTLPRELRLIGDKIYQYPIEELKLLRKLEVCYKNIEILNKEVSLANLNGDVLELFVEIINNESSIFRINFRNNAILEWKPDSNVVTLKRKGLIKSNIEERHCKIEDLKNLTIYLDTSSIEIFLNDGQEVFTSRIYPLEQEKDITIFSDERTQLNIKKWNLEK